MNYCDYYYCLNIQQKPNFLIITVVPAVWFILSIIFFNLGDSFQTPWQKLNHQIKSNVIFRGKRVNSWLRCSTSQTSLKHRYFPLSPRFPTTELNLTSIWIFWIILQLISPVSPRHESICLHDLLCPSVGGAGRQTERERNILLFI